MKKPWTTPKLIVLVRGNLEEFVLAACKTFLVSGPDNAAPGCYQTLCQDCSASSDS